MPAVDFSLASSLVVAPGPLAEGVTTTLWTSAEVTQGGANNSVRVTIAYEAIVPDTEVVSPFDFALALVVEQQQDSGAWREVGRQNQGLRKLSQGAVRTIMISPSLASKEEGVDGTVGDLDGSVAYLRSFSPDDVTGSLRARLIAIDNAPAGANPFQSVTITVDGKRYEA